MLDTRVGIKKEDQDKLFMLFGILENEVRSEWLPIELGLVKTKSWFTLLLDTEENKDTKAKSVKG